MTVPDTATAARLVVGAVESLVHRFITRPAPPSPDEIARFETALVTMLHRYLTAPARSPAARQGGSRSVDSRP